MPDLPLILLGPVLRRVEPRGVSVFVATSQASNIRVTLYDGQVDAAAPPPELANHETHTMRFGAAFHAVVVTISLEGAAALQPGHLYSYDVRVSPEGGSAKSLKDLDLLTDSTLTGYGTITPASEDVEVCALGYVENRLPSFVTCPMSLDELVLAHASCRKPHGEGSPALQYLDGYIDGLEGAPAGRPHMLFLTGDQIYADDVAAALLPGLTALGIQLLGGAEQVPSPRGGSPLTVHTTVLPPGFRQKVTASAGFTSDAASCHLIGFGEWLAMYCAAWNPALWPVLAVADSSDPSIDHVLKQELQDDASKSQRSGGPVPPVVLGQATPDAPADVITPLYSGTVPARNALNEARESFWPAKQRLDDFRREVPKVRRLLANVPTYMICDDHEVTDDWFMTGGIRAATVGKPFGKALLRNALAAYTICQAWGDDPQRWATDQDHKDMLARIADMFPDGWPGGLARSAASDAVDQLLGLAPGAQPAFDFSFTVDGSMHRVRVLDTRTRRQYDTPSACPGLLTEAALSQQLPQEDLPEGHVLILVSPAPVFGPPFMTEIGGAIFASIYDLMSMARSETDRSAAQDVTGITPGGKPAGMQYFDIEHWGAHPGAYERLLERLSHYPRVVVLAGDVHYGSAFAMDWTAPQATGHPRTGRIVHFTSSAARNGWPSFFRNLFALNGMATGLQHIGLPMTRLGWSNTLPPVVSDIQFGPGVHFGVELGPAVEPPLTRIRLQTAPVLLSNEMFRAAHDLAREPEWIWRAQPITDQRPPADRPLAARVPEPTTDLPNDSSAVHRYDEAATVHVKGLGTAAIARGLQFLNNAGLITFSTSGDGIHVSQALYSLRARPDPNEKGDAYIVHEARLEPDPVPVPSRIGPGA